MSYYIYIVLVNDHTITCKDWKIETVKRTFIRAVTTLYIMFFYKIIKNIVAYNQLSMV